MIGIDDGVDHRADVEWLLAIAVRRLREDLADRAELAALRRMWMVPHIAIWWILGRHLSRPALAGCSVREAVVLEQEVDGGSDGRGEVLGLPVGAHDPGVAADAQVVLGRHTAGVVDRLLASEHHRALGCHHENAGRVHQHRRLGVPVGLGADVDPGDDDVDLATALGVFDETPQHAGNPVEVLAARVHGDLRPGGKSEPLDRHVHCGRQLDRRDDPHTLRLSDAAHRLRWVPEQSHASDPFRIRVAGTGHDADDDAGAVLTRRAVDWDQPTLVVDVVLDERAVWPGEQRSQLVRVNESTAAGLDALAGVVVEWLHRLRRRLCDPYSEPVARLVPEP